MRRPKVRLRKPQFPRRLQAWFQEGQQWLSENIRAGKERADASTVTTSEHGAHTTPPALRLRVWQAYPGEQLKRSRRHS